MKGARMNKLANLLRVAAFLLSALLSAGAFGGFAVWVASTLDPATLEVIGLLSSPWVVVPKKADSHVVVQRLK
jgi:hypothetical protein